MFNRLRRWLYRRIEGAPHSPLSVQVSDPWTIERIERELRPGFGFSAYAAGGPVGRWSWRDEDPRLKPGLYPQNPYIVSGHNDFGHDAVQLQADYDADYDCHLGSDY